MRLIEIELQPTPAPIPDAVAHSWPTPSCGCNSTTPSIQASIPAFVPSDFEQVYRALAWIDVVAACRRPSLSRMGQRHRRRRLPRRGARLRRDRHRDRAAAGRDRRIVRRRPRRRRRIRLRQLRSPRRGAVRRHRGRSHLAPHRPPRQLRRPRPRTGRFRHHLRLPLAGRGASHLRPLRKLCRRRRAAAHVTTARTASACSGKCGAKSAAQFFDRITGLAKIDTIKFRPWH